MYVIIQLVPYSLLVRLVNCCELLCMASCRGEHIGHATKCANSAGNTLCPGKEKYYATPSTKVRMGNFKQLHHDLIEFDYWSKDVGSQFRAQCEWLMAYFGRPEAVHRGANCRGREVREWRRGNTCERGMLSRYMESFGSLLIYLYIYIVMY